MGRKRKEWLGERLQERWQDISDFSGEGTAARGKYEILNRGNNRTMVGKSGREGYLKRVGWRIWQLNF